jgi:hypothetical protein
LVEGDTVLAGAACYPALSEILVAAPGRGCWWNGARCAVSEVTDRARHGPHLRRALRGALGAPGGLAASHARRGAATHLGRLLRLPAGRDRACRGDGGPGAPPWEPHR